MRILIVSDTHGSVDRVYRIYYKLAASQPVDLIVHCGDYYEDAMAIRAHLGVRVAAVRGNCDRCFDENEFTVLETEAGSFYICHGHMNNVKHNKQGLYFNALSKGCIGAVYGHTHRAEKTEFDNFIFINPGSITKPRDGSGGSFALLTTGENRVEAEIFSFHDFFSGEDDSPKSPSAKPKVKGGYLRDLINYSDRF